MAKIFFSYSHKDKEVREKVEQHLSILRRSSVIETWYDNDVLAGGDFDKTIKKELEAADIILLLVSPNFLDSNYCYDIEMKRALEKHHNGEARIVPILVDVCDWKHTDLAKLKTVPTDGKAIKKYGNRSEAYQNITDEIRRLANSVNSPAHQVLKAAVNNKNSKVSSFTTKLIKITRFTKRYYKLLVGIIVVGSITAFLPKGSLLQGELEYVALRAPIGRQSISSDLNKDGYLDRATFVSSNSSIKKQGLYILLSDKNTKLYREVIHKTDGIWSGRDPTEETWLELDQDTLVVNFNALMSSERDYQVSIAFVDNAPIVSTYSKTIDGSLACSIDYLSGIYSLDGGPETYPYPVANTTLQMWHKGIVPFECL